MASEPRLTDDGIELEENPLVDLDEMRSDFNDHLEVVAETDDIVVFRDNAGNELNQWAEDLGVERGCLSRVMHDVALEHTEYNEWNVHDPVVICK